MEVAYARNDIANAYRNNGFAGYGNGSFNSMESAYKNGLVSGYTKSNYNGNAEKDLATGGAAVMTAGVVKAFGITKLGGVAAAVGLGSAPLVGLAAVAAGGAVAAVAAYKSKDMIARGIGKGAEFALKSTGKALGLSGKGLGKIYSSYQKSAKTKSEYLEKANEATKQKEEKFKGLVKTTRKDLVNGKDIKDDLKQMYKLKIPTQKSMHELHKLTADHVLKNNSKSGKLDMVGVKKEVDGFAKEVGLSKNETKVLHADVRDRLEEHKDNFRFDKDNKVVKLGANKKKATQKAKEINTKQEKTKAKSVEKKQKAPAPKQKTPHTKGKSIGSGKEMGR